jgi:hypothetical protein
MVVPAFFLQENYDYVAENARERMPLAVSAASVQHVNDPGFAPAREGAALTN